MAKKWITIIAIAALLIAGCVLETVYINKTFDKLEGRLNYYAEMLDKTKDNIATEKNITYIQETEDSWHGDIMGLKSLIWHTGIKDIEIGLSRIKTYTKQNDYTESLAELYGLIDYLEHYVEDFSLSIENLLYIFNDDLFFV